MPRKKYEHSAYYYAYRYGWTYSEARTFAGKYLDQHTYRPRMRKRPDGEWCSKDWFKWKNATKEPRKDANGNEFKLSVGNTWVMVADQNTDITYEVPEEAESTESAE